MLALDLNMYIVVQILEILLGKDTEITRKMEEEFLKMEAREFKMEVLLLGSEMFAKEEFTLYELVRLNQLINKL